MPINHVVQVVKKSKFYKSQKPLLSDGGKVFNHFMNCPTSVNKSTILHSVITFISTLESLLQSRLEGDLSKKLNKKVCSSSNFLLSSRSQAADCSSCFGENVFKMGPNPDKPARLIIRLLFGFASDLDLPYSSPYQFCRFGIC